MSFHLQDPNDQSGSAFQFYGLRHDWSDANASWDNYDAGATWGTPGARNTTNDRYATILATTPAGGTPPSWISTTLNGDGIARLQRWIDGVDPDYSFAIQDYADTMGDGFRLDSFDSANPPRLAVQYCPPSATQRVMYPPLVAAPGD